DGRTLLERAGGGGRGGDVDVAAARALGAAIADRTTSGRDKLYLNPPPRMAALAYWIEQLVAESSGKDGRGVVPIVQDPAGGALRWAARRRSASARAISTRRASCTKADPTAACFS